MKSVSGVLLALALTGCSLTESISAEAPVATAQRSLPTVVSVNGADNLTLNIDGQAVEAQIACIDAQRGAEVATNRLRELLPTGQTVQARIIDEQTTPARAELFLGNESVGLMLVREGLATVDPATVSDCAATQNLLLQAQETAQQNQFGIWGVSAFDSALQTGMRPNAQFEINAESGTCPDTVGLWEFSLGFEGGADHTVVIDTAAIASQPAQLTTSEAKRVVYEAPLKSEFASCVGTANSEYLSMYDLSFADGKLQFNLNLTNDDGFREIRYANVSANRPYVHWRAAE